LVEGHLKAYDFLRGKTENWFFETFNLWVGRWISVLELVKLTEKVIWKKIPYDIIDKREGDLASVYCEPSKAKEILNWEARTSIEDSVRSGVKFMEGNK
jgi:UDP-glucose 4-epimerase